MKGKVLITDRVHEVLVQGLEELGYEVDYIPEYDPGDLAEDIGDYTGIIINSKIRMTSGIIDAAPALNFIGRLGSGLEIIDTPYAKSKGVLVFNSPEGNRNAVAEHVMGMLLCLYRNIAIADRQLRKGVWKREANRGEELAGKTIGIIGLGNTGRSLAHKLSGWTLDVIYNDPYVLKTPEDLDYISSVTLDELCARSDIISLHVPLTSETNRMVDDSFIRKCGQNPVIINTSRGAVVDTPALVKALESGQVRGACLDVFENEKPHSFTIEEDQLYNRLYAMPHVVLTPHIAGWTHASLYKIAKVLLDKVAAAKL